MLKGILSAISAKTVGIIAGAAAVVAAAGITMAVIFSGTDSYRVLKVFELNGTAAVERESAGELDAYVGMNLESGDVITVNSGSMRLSLDNSKYVLLEEGTVLELVAVGTSADSKTTLNLREGAVLSEITESLSANSFYEVNVPKSTMAVRGTSFRVSLRKQSDGSYIADISTFHGRVAVQLFNEGGSKKGGEVIVGENSSAKIKTEDTGSRNPEIDGRAYFVIIDPEKGEVRAVNDGENPVFDTDYSEIPEEVIRIILNSDEINRLKLSEPVLAAIRGDDKQEEQTSTAAETSAPVTSAEETEKTSAEMTASESTLLPPETESAVSAAAPETRVSTAPANTPESSPKTETSAQTTPETTKKTTTSTAETKVTSEETTTTTTTAAETTTTTTTTTITTTTTTTTAATSRPYIPAPPTSATTEEVVGRVNVIFRYENGEEIIIPTDVGGTVSQIPAVPEKQGYTGRWIIPAGIGDFIELTVGTVITSETVVSVRYEPNEYTVTFVADGITCAQVIGYYDSCLSEDEIPEIPEKEHYTGIKWVCDGAEFTAETVINGDMTVTAEYETNKYTVTYAAGYDSSVIIATEAVDYGTAAPRIDIPDEYMAVDTDGDGFMNYMVWRWEETELGIVGEDTVITVPYAVYSNIFEVRINSGASIITKLYEMNEEITLPAEPDNKAEMEADGYVFVNWKSSSGDGKFESTKPGRTDFVGYYREVEAGETITVDVDYTFRPNYIKPTQIKLKYGDEEITDVRCGSEYAMTAFYTDSVGFNMAKVYDGDVEFSVTGLDSGGNEIAVKDGTTISAGGLLTVAADETAAKLKITAKSTKYGVQGTLELSVVSP